MSVPKSEHKVYIYKNDYNAMCTEVYKHQHMETGGNLFGLWTTSGSAVIQVVLGPGKNCRRTETSFHQDIEYMHRIGRFVNDNYMLCHIGEWCSQHSLSLNKPSSGDEQTIKCNFPQGVTKFLVIFANIRNTDTIVLSPYFFTDEGRRYEKAEYVVLDSDGPFSHDDKFVEQIHLGAEGENNDDETPSKREIALKKVHDQLKKWFGNESESMFSMETREDCPGAVEISFKHNRKFWMVRFPKGFPIDPTEIFCSQFQERVRLSVSKVHKIDLVEPLKNDVNILLSIRKRCGDRRCNVCTHLIEESLCRPGFC